MAPRKRKADVAQEHVGTTKRNRCSEAVIEARSTRMMTTNAPRKAVFDTTELLENILLQLPSRTLFGIQRVCKQFQTLIKDSTPLRERMYLQLPTSQPQPARLGLVHHRSQAAVRKAYYVPVDLDFKDPTYNTYFNPNHAILVGHFNPLLVPGPCPLDLLNRLQGGDTRQLDVGRRPLREQGSWRKTYLADILYSYTSPIPDHVSRTTTTIKWCIPGRKAISGRITRTNHYWESPTLGKLFDDVFKSYTYDTSFQYTYGKEFRERKGWVDKQIERLEKQAGREAVLDSMVVSIKDVAMLSEEEAASIEDWNPSAMLQSE